MLFVGDAHTDPQLYQSMPRRLINVRLEVHSPSNQQLSRFPDDYYHSAHLGSSPSWAKCATEADWGPK